MVGDSATDVDTAIAAGVPVVAVTFGYSATPVAELGATALIDHYDELYETVALLHRPASGN
jgi:phosphoglycolate phosphatase